MFSFSHLTAGAGLAPMAGITDMPTRMLAHEMGSAWSVSEMLSAKGFLFMGPDHRATRELLERSPDEGYVGLQLFGHEPEVIAEAAKRLSDSGFDFIDFNMGCPAPKIVSNGEGSALMKDPALIGRIVSALSRATHLPVSVKIRKGWDDDSVNCVEVARIAEENGAQAITVHGRTRMQFYSGYADWDAIAAVKSAVSIPVFGNGDITTALDAQRMLTHTHCDSVMIGRGAQGNPWLFREIYCHFHALPYVPPTITDRIDMALRHLNMESSLRGNDRAMREMRKQIAWYISGARGSVKFRKKINSLKTIESVREALGEYRRETDENGSPRFS